MNYRSGVRFLLSSLFMDVLEKTLASSEATSAEEVGKLLNSLSQSQNDLPAQSLVSIVRKHVEKPAVQSFLHHPRIFPFLKYYLYREEDGLCEWYRQQANTNDPELLKAIRIGKRSEMARAIKRTKDRESLELYFAGLTRRRLQAIESSSFTPPAIPTLSTTDVQSESVEQQNEEQESKRSKVGDFTLDSLILEK